MALTNVIKKVYVIGDRKEVVFDATFDNSYRNAGAGDHGEAIVGPDIGLDIELTYISSGTLQKSDGSSAFHCSYDAASGQLRAYKANGTTDLTPVASGVDLSTYTARLRAVGKGSASAA